MAPKFKRTYAAAKYSVEVERQSEWDVIESIAADAVDDDIPITGIDSVLSAKDALDAAGKELADRSVERYCLLAKFDYEATARDRRVFRRYGHSIVMEFATAGWSQEAAAEYLMGDKKTQREVRAKIGSLPSSTKVKASLDSRWTKWLSKFGTLIEEGATLAEETDRAKNVVLGGYGQLGYLMYERAVSDGLDAEYHELLENAEAE